MTSGGRKARRARGGDGCRVASVYELESNPKKNEYIHLGELALSKPFGGGKISGNKMMACRQLVPQVGPLFPKQRAAKWQMSNERSDFHWLPLGRPLGLVAQSSVWAKFSAKIPAKILIGPRGRQFDARRPATERAASERQVRTSGK